MTLTNLAVFSAGAFALLHFVIVPRLTRRQRVFTPVEALRSAGLLAVLQFARTLALALALSSSVLAALVWWNLQRAPEHTLEAIRVLQARASESKAWIQALKAEWTVYGLVFLVLVLAWIAHRNAKRRADGVLSKLFQDKLRELRIADEKGELERLPSTPQMQKIEKELAELAILERSLEDHVLKGEISREDAVALREKIATRASTLMFVHEQQNLSRRIDLKVDPDAFAVAPPETTREKIQTFFVSEGLVRSLGLGSRGLLVATLLLLVPSLVSISSAQLQGAYEARIASLAVLTVKVSQKEVDEDWKRLTKELGPTVEAEAWSKSDDAAADAIADSFADALASAGSFRTIPRVSAQVVRGARTTRVREAVLAEFAVARGDQTVGVREVAGSSSSDDDFLHAVADQPEQPGKAAFREQVRKDLKDLADHEPGAWAKLKDVAASFQRPASERTVARQIVSNMYGMALEGAVGAEGELAQLSQQLARELGPDRVRDAYRTNFQRFTTQSMRSRDAASSVAEFLVVDDPPPVFTPVENDKLESMLAQAPKPDEVIERIAQRPPSLIAHTDKGVDYAEASRAAMKFSPDRRDAAQAFATYEDYFPGQLGADERTPSARYAMGDKSDDVAQAALPEGGGSFGGGGPGGGAPSGDGSPRRPPPGGPRPSGGPGVSSPHGSASSPWRPSSHPSAPVRSSAVASFSRARSYSGLRGFARVGGVLIGRGPEAADLDVRDLSYRFEDGRLLMRLHIGADKEIPLPAFRASMVSYALAYAADGRQTAVTMVRADPLPDLRVLVHPALIDTPLGCRAIELDRFVDTYAGGTLRLEASEVVNAHLSLYEAAQRAQLSELLGQELMSPEAQKLRSRVEGAIQSALKHPRMVALMQLGLQRISELNDPRRSPFAAKTELFDRATLATLKSCGAANRDASSFVECARKTTNFQVKELPPRTEFTVWSGVREQEFKVDGSLSFIRMPSDATAAASLWPFRFMLQTAFTAVAAQDSESFVDPDPWEFPAISSWITSEVWKGLNQPENAKHLEVLRDMAEFTYLQRIFRLAFEGRFGDEFPIERLRELARDSKPYMSKPTPTPRWNVRPLESLQPDVLRMRRALGVKATAPVACAPL